jgi:predicted dehydrogenase
MIYYPFTLPRKKQLHNIKNEEKNMAQGRIRWGILGTSPIAKTVCEAITKSRTGVVAAIGSRTLDKALQLGEMVTTAFPDTAVLIACDYAKILEDNTIDAIYIALPNALHAEWILKSLAAGKHVLCEKPFVISLPQMLAVKTEALGKPGLFCMEALMYRCHPVIKKLMSVVHAENKIGDILKYTASYTANIRHLANPVEGGAIRNLGCYPVSLVRLLARAEPIKIKGKGVIDSTQANDSSAEVRLDFSDSSVATIKVADDREMEWKFEIEGTEGTIEFLDNPWKPEDALPTRFILKNKDGQQTISAIATQRLYSLEIDNLGFSVWNKQFSAGADVSLDDSMGNVAVIETWRNRVFEKNFGATIGNYLHTHGQFSHSRVPPANESNTSIVQHTASPK